jgi:hypothetical protein
VPDHRRGVAFEQPRPDVQRVFGREILRTYFENLLYLLRRKREGLTEQTLRRVHLTRDDVASTPERLSFDGPLFTAQPGSRVAGVASDLVPVLNTLLPRPSHLGPLPQSAFSVRSNLPFADQLSPHRSLGSDECVELLR